MPITDRIHSDEGLKQIHCIAKNAVTWKMFANPRNDDEFECFVKVQTFKENIVLNCAFKL